jgi:hypothetical protein
MYQKMFYLYNGKEIESNKKNKYRIKNGSFSKNTALRKCDNCDEFFSTVIHYKYFDMSFNQVTIHGALKHNLLNPVLKKHLMRHQVPKLLPKMITIPNPELE